MNGKMSLRLFGDSEPPLPGLPPSQVVREMPCCHEPYGSVGAGVIRLLVSVRLIELSNEDTASSSVLPSSARLVGGLSVVGESDVIKLLDSKDSDGSATVDVLMVVEEESVGTSLWLEVLAFVLVADASHS